MSGQWGAFYKLGLDLGPCVYRVTTPAGAMCIQGYHSCWGRVCTGLTLLLGHMQFLLLRQGQEQNIFFAFMNEKYSEEGRTLKGIQVMRRQEVPTLGFILDKWSLTPASMLCHFISFLMPMHSLRILFPELKFHCPCKFRIKAFSYKHHVSPISLSVIIFYFILFF